MRAHIFAISALSLAFVSAQAGTIVFHTGDMTRPTLGIDGWSTATSGSIVSMNVNHYDHATFGTDVWVEEISGGFSHSRGRFDTVAGQGATSGSVIWWFEYIPDNPLDVPTGTYYADLQVRAQATMTQIANGSGSGPVTIDSGVDGLQTQLTAMTPIYFANFGVIYPFSTGSPWNLDAATSGFGFTWDAILGKYVGKAQWGNSAVTQFNSTITLGTNTMGSDAISVNRQLKVLQVRTSGGTTFTFNSPWT